jgi:hypothetical protein
MAVFRVDRDFTVILNPDAVKLIPELSTLSQEELLFVILVEDYEDGPFRKKPLEERWSMALKKVFKGESVNLENDKIRLARKGYKSLVFDVRRETRDIYLKRIDMYRKELMIVNIEFKKMKEIDQAIQYLEDRIGSIDKSLEADDIANVKLKGDRQLSYIEIWQQRQKEFRKYNQT